MTEMDKVERLLIAMPERYRAVVAVLETMDDEKLTVEMCKARLLEDELRNQIMDTTASDSQSAGAAFNSVNTKRHSARPPPNLPPGAVWCYDCGVAGHKRPACPKKSTQKPKFKPNRKLPKNYDIISPELMFQRTLGFVTPSVLSYQSS